MKLISIKKIISITKEEINDKLIKKDIKKPKINENQKEINNNINDTDFNLKNKKNKKEPNEEIENNNEEDEEDRKYM